MTTSHVELTEYATEFGLDLTDEQSRALTASKGVTATVSAVGPGLVDLTADKYVGVVSVPGLEISILPKVGIPRLLFLIAYAMGLDGWDSRTAELADVESLPLAIAHAFTHHSNTALSQGVIQGYRTEERALTTLRGRLREGDQLRRNFGLALPLEVRFDEFSIDVAENQLLKSAAVRLLAIRDVDGSVRRSLRRVVRRLEGVSVITPGAPMPHVRHDRRNARYRHALILARLVLQSASVELGAVSTAATGMLFNMNEVFERFMARAMREAFAKLGGTLHRHRPVYLDSGSNIRLEPDLTWVVNGLPVAVMDLKYKSLAAKSLPNADVYQALAYCLALGLPTAHLIYAEGNEAPAIHHIPSTGSEVKVWTVPLGLPVNRLFEAVESIVTDIAHTAASATLQG